MRLGNRTCRGYVDRIQSIKNLKFLIPSSRYTYFFQGIGFLKRDYPGV